MIGALFTVIAILGCSCVLLFLSAQDWARKLASKEEDLGRALQMIESLARHHKQLLERFNDATRHRTSAAVPPVQAAAPEGLVSPSRYWTTRQPLPGMQTSERFTASGEAAPVDTRQYWWDRYNNRSRIDAPLVDPPVGPLPSVRTPADD